MEVIFEQLVYCTVSVCNLLFVYVLFTFDVFRFLPGWNENMMCLIDNSVLSKYAL